MNPMDLLKNLQSLQSQMGGMKEKLKSLQTEGTSGGDLVRVVINGEMDVLEVHIDPVAVDPRDVKMLEELVQAAFTGAVSKMKTIIQTEAGGMAAALGIVPGSGGSS